MRYLASVPFILLMMALGLVLIPLVGFTCLTARTVLLIRGDDLHGPTEQRSAKILNRVLKFLGGRCPSCDAFVVD
jgi:hypothetical protein